MAGAGEEDERVEEFGALAAIFPELKSNLSTFTASLDIPVTPAEPLLVRFIPQTKDKSVVLQVGQNGTHTNAAASGGARVEGDTQLAHLPPLYLQVTLPHQYPAHKPPQVQLKAKQNWLPAEKLKELEDEAEKLWEEYGHCQILYSYIDHLQQTAEGGFDLAPTADGCLVLPSDLEKPLVAFAEETKLAVFNAGTDDCGICLEPKKGTACHQMANCGHVFCRDCLKESYDNYIAEGSIAAVRCLDPTCGKDLPADAPKPKAEKTLLPRELLAMGIDEPMVRRYVEMKRKKKLESDKTTVYCPRTWCQGPARNKKYPPIPADLSTYEMTEYDDEVKDGDSGKPNASSSSAAGKLTKAAPEDRLSVCAKCELAFCKVCYAGWHGDFARCYPRDPNELSVEEKASYEYIRANTSPCPSCNSPTQKTMGCNHMNCFQCNTHFCYLCGAWLDPGNPYQHFNTLGTECYHRLWELEEGDEGQGPQDGRGFVGARRWEQMAIDAAREADEAEREANAAGAPAEEEEEEEAAEDVRAAQLEQELIEAQIAELNLVDEPEQPAQPAPRPRGGRRQRNPVPARQPAGNGQAQAVRQHERGGRGNGRRGG
jgi:E3 ubiquitin-protein ligase RNF14